MKGRWTLAYWSYLMILYSNCPYENLRSYLTYAYINSRAMRERGLMGLGEREWGIEWLD
jgi:hypothetical protein